MKTENYTVYMHKTPNNKVYIGVTSQSPEQRFRKEGTGYRSQKLFWRAIQKYGWDNIEHNIIATNLTKEIAYKFEVMLIAEYKSDDAEYGYNLSKGGECASTGYHWSLSDETKKKMSRARLGENHPFYGKHHSDSTKEKIRNSMMGNTNAKGSVRSDEFKERVSRATKGRVLSDETKEKLRQKALEQWKRQKGETWRDSH